MDKRLTILDALVIIFSIFTLVTLTIELLYPMDSEMRNLVNLIDTAASIVFIVDWYKRFKESNNKIKFSIINFIDLIASIPYYVIPYLGYAKSIRLFKLLRVFKAFRSAKVLLQYIRSNSHYGMKLIFIVVLTIMIIAGSSSILIVESNDPNSNIKTAEEALWWSFVTLATVGYGDYYPVTTAGRLIAVVMSLGGIGLFGAFTGTLMTYFIEDKNEKNTDKSER